MHSKIVTEFFVHRVRKFLKVVKEFMKVTDYWVRYEF
jgi:hypothetical protein